MPSGERAHWACIHSIFTGIRFASMRRKGSQRMITLFPREFITHRWSSCVVPATVLGAETTAMKKTKSRSHGADTMMGKKAEEKNARYFQRVTVAMKRVKA